MAASSIYTNVIIKNKSDCLKLVSALEQAKNKKVNEAEISQPIEIVRGENIRKLFE